MLVGYISHYIFGISIFLTSTFLIMLVLVQRGRGGGIAGALGGAGGQSAFGTKAGDLFTRITVGMATFWILLCIVAILSLRESAFTTGVDKQQGKSGVVSGVGAETKTGTESAALSEPGSENVQSKSETTNPETTNAATSDPAAVTQESVARQDSGGNLMQSNGDVTASTSADGTQVTTQPSSTEQPQGTEQPDSTEQPLSGDPAVSSDVAPEVSELGSDNPVTAPE